VKKNSIVILFLMTAVFHYKVCGQSYTVKKIPAGRMAINGKGDAAAWNSANKLTRFIYPWENTKPPATSFAALHDGQWLYLLYTVKDDSVIVFSNTNEKRETGASDRVEIFFKMNDKMSPYYCIEMDASARVLDYKADYYRQMHYEWQWPKDQLVVKTYRTNEGYIVEAAISITSLKKMGLLKNKQLQAGLFRAERTGTDYNGKAILKWISWIDPKTAEPDFHLPGAFGLLKLE
jgi:hypothetical protein